MSGGTTMYPGIADRMQKEKERSWKRSKPFGLGQGVEFEEELEVTEGEGAGAGTAPPTTPPPLITTGIENTGILTKATQRNIRRGIALSATTTAGELNVSIN